VAALEGNVRLAGAAITELDDVLVADHVLRTRQLHDQHLVECRDRQEVERVEALHRRELCCPDTAIDQTALALDQLQLGESQQIAGMVDAFSRTFASDLLVLGQERRQLQRLQMMREQNLWLVSGLGHAAAPSSRAA
jgi:lipopolysaccharide biosynthesis regulator YciM